MDNTIRNIEQLKELSRDDACDCFILLSGSLRSSKHILWDEQADRFVITNEIDGSEQVLSEKELMDKGRTNIGYAMSKGALYKY